MSNKGFKLFLNIVLINFALTAFAEEAIVKWARSAGGNNNESASSVSTDEQGNVFIAGTFRSNSINFGTTTLINNNAPNTSMFVVKYDSLGQVLWAKHSGDNAIAYGFKVAIDKVGNAVVCGHFNSSNITFGSTTFVNNYAGTYAQLYIVKYDPLAKVIWARNSTNTTLSNTVYSVCVDNEGNIYAAGHFQDSSITIAGITITNNSSPTQNAFLLKLDSSGNGIWGKSIGGTGHDVARAVTTDNEGNVYVSGEYSSLTVNLGAYTLTSVSTASNNFLIKYNKDGDLKWAKSAMGDLSNFNYHVAADQNNNSYICGAFKSNELDFSGKKLYNSNPNFLKSYVAKYDPNGEVVWAKSFAASLKGDEIKHVCVDKENNVYINGTFSSPILEFDTLKLINQSTGSDMFTLKLDQNAKVIWGRSYGSTSDESNLSCAIGKKNQLYVAGEFKSQKVQLDSTQLENSLTNYSDIHLLKLIQIDKPDSITVKYCSADSTATLKAQSGYYSYVWKNNTGDIIGYDSILVVKYPFVGDKYSCELSTDEGQKYNLETNIIDYKLNANFSWEIADCKLNNVKFTNRSTSSHNPMYFKWSFGDGTYSSESNPIHSYSIAGKYLVTLQTSNPFSACSDAFSDEIEVYSPMNVKILGDSLCCEGYTITLHAVGADSYLWSNGSTADTLVVNEHSGKVWVVGFYSSATCKSDTIFKIIKNGKTEITLSGLQTYCPTFTTSIKANGAKNYTWSTGESTDSILVEHPGGDLWVTGYSENGCETDTLFFSVTEEPDWDFTLNGSLVFCENDSTEISVSGSKKQLWSNNKTESSIFIQTPGNYSVIGQNDRGCEKQLSFNVLQSELPKVDFEISAQQLDVRNNQLTVQIEAEKDVTYSWDMGDGFIKTGNKVSYEYNVKNNILEYIITLTAINKVLGCQNLLSKSIDVVPFIPNVFTPNGDGVNDVFMPDMEIQITDRYGKVLFKGFKGWDGTYQGKELSNDNYFYYLYYNDKNLKVKSKKGVITLIR